MNTSERRLSRRSTCTRCSRSTSTATQPLGADHAVFYPVITRRTTSSVSGTAVNNAIVEVYLSSNDPGLYGPGAYLRRQHGGGRATGDWSLPAALPAGAIVTATATAYGEHQHQRVRRRTSPSPARRRTSTA